MRRFPRRTILVMVLFLVVFWRLWEVTHREPREPEERAPRAALPPGAVQVAPSGGGAVGVDACQVLEEALGAAIASPGNERLERRIPLQLVRCGKPTPRACEQAGALRAGGSSLGVEISQLVCARCPPGTPTCPRPPADASTPR